MSTTTTPTEQPRNFNTNIEIVVDGVQVKAIAYRTYRSHTCEIFEPFHVVGEGTQQPLFAVPSYQKYLQTRNLLEDSISLVRWVYNDYKTILTPELVQAYAERRKELLFASATLDRATRNKVATKTVLRVKFKNNEISENKYINHLKELKNSIT